MDRQIRKLNRFTNNAVFCLGKFNIRLRQLSVKALLLF